MVAANSGAGEIWVCEKENLRIDTARKLGFVTIDVKQSDPVAAVFRETENRGADIVFEAAGAEETVLLASRLCRVRGEIVQIAIPKETRPIDIVDLTFKELTIKGVRVYAPYDFERAIRLAGKAGFDFEPFLTSFYPLDKAEEAIKKAAQGKEVMRVIFEVSD